MTLLLNARAAELKMTGKSIISLSVGEPDFDTPAHVKEAAIKAIHDGQTKYTASDGTASLKEAIQEKFQHENNLQYDANQIIVSSGAKHILFNLYLAALNPEDEAVIPAPYWVSYPQLVKVTDAKPIFINTSIKQQYKITPEQLQVAMSDKTRLVFINNPSNPSGKAYSKAELQAFANILLQYPKAIIMSDDIYEHIWWHEEAFSNIVMACPELYDRTIIVNGVSKSYAMTGWRIGYAAGPAKLIAAMKKLQSQNISCPCSISQAAAEAALTGDQTCIQNMAKAFKKRHDFIYQALQSIDGIETIPSDGTFYIFPNVQTLIDRMDHIHSDLEFSDHLLSEAGVAITPGSAFGCPGSIRISYATNIDRLKDAVERIDSLL